MSTNHSLSMYISIYVHLHDNTFVNLMYIMVISQMYRYGHSVYVYMNVCMQTYTVDVCIS